MTFDLRQLTAFTTIVATGSLGRSADALHVTQPALSRTIKRLEEQVGAPLFERHSKGMQLTAIGQALLPHATLLLQEAGHARDEINAMRGLTKGLIRVGAVGSIASLVLPLAIGGVLKKYPNLQVEVIEGVWDRLTDALVRHEVDLALGMAVPDTDDICAIGDCHWEDSSHVVAALDHPLRSKAGLTLADTLAQPWAIPPQSTGPVEQMREVYAAHGLPMPEIMVATRSVIVLKSLVTQSGFLSWMPEPMYDIDRKAGSIDALDIPGATARRTLTAFRRRHGILPGPAVKLLDELRRLTVNG